MRRAVFLIVLAMFSCVQAYAEAVQNCSSSDSRAKQYYRSISYAEFGSEIEIKEIARGLLLEYAAEVQGIASWNKKYSGPDKEYIPVLIDLLNQNAGLHQELSCFWAAHQDEDLVRKFTDKEKMVFREGYGLFRKGVLVAYFYSKIAVV